MAAPAPELFPENLNKNNNLCLYISLPDPSHEKIVSLFDEFALSMHCSPCEEKNCRYHLILKDKSVGEILTKVKNFRIKYQLVDNLFYQYYFFLKNPINVKGSTMKLVENAVYIARRYSLLYFAPISTDKFHPGVEKKRLKRKKFRQNYEKLTQKSVKTQTDDGGCDTKNSSCLQQRIDEICKSNLAFDFVQIVDCFYAKRGTVKSHNVVFRLM